MLSGTCCGADSAVIVGDFNISVDNTPLSPHHHHRHQDRGTYKLWILDNSGLPQHLTDSAHNKGARSGPHHFRGVWTFFFLFFTIALTDAVLWSFLRCSSSLIYLFFSFERAKEHCTVFEQADGLKMCTSHSFRPCSPKLILLRAYESKRREPRWTRSASGTDTQNIHKKRSDFF